MPPANPTASQSVPMFVVQQMGPSASPSAVRARDGVSPVVVYRSWVRGVAERFARNARSSDPSTTFEVAARPAVRGRDCSTGGVS